MQEKPRIDDGSRPVTPLVIRSSADSNTAWSKEDRDLRHNSLSGSTSKSSSGSSENKEDFLARSSRGTGGFSTSATPAKVDTNQHTHDSTVKPRDGVCVGQKSTPQPSHFFGSQPPTTSGKVPKDGLKPAPPSPAPVSANRTSGTSFGGVGFGAVTTGAAGLGSSLATLEDGGAESKSGSRTYFGKPQSLLGASNTSPGLFGASSDKPQSLLGASFGKRQSQSGGFG